MFVVCDVARDLDLRIETCWNDFKFFNVKFYMCALVGVLIESKYMFIMSYIYIYISFLM